MSTLNCSRVQPEDSGVYSCHNQSVNLNIIAHASQDYKEMRLQLQEHVIQFDYSKKIEQVCLVTTKAINSISLKLSWHYPDGKVIDWNLIWFKFILISKVYLLISKLRLFKIKYRWGLIPLAMTRLWKHWLCELIHLWFRLVLMSAVLKLAFK